MQVGRLWCVMPASFAPSPAVDPPVPAALPGVNRRTAGFSVLELLIVVGIIVVVGAIGMPQLNSGVRRHRLQASASMIAGKLTDARINALKRNRATWLLVDAAAGTVQVQTTGAGGPVNIGGAGQLSEGVTFGAVPAQVDYDAMGRSTAVQTIQVTSAGQVRTVTVSLTGTATIN